MSGRTHAGIGIITFFAIYHRIPGGFSYLGVFISLLASLLPDIDHPKSTMNKYILPFKNKSAKVAVYLCIGITILWLDYQYTKEPLMKALGCLFIAVALSSHREGITHSLAGMILFSAICGYIGKKYNFPSLIYYFMIGYGMHLLCDMANNRGIPLFYPFKNKKVKLPLTYRVGSKTGEWIEGMLMVTGLIYILYKIPFL